MRKIYTTEEVETTALNNVNIEINEKEFVAIMGPSGCGKSTLLNIFGLLDNLNINLSTSPKLSYDDVTTLSPGFNPLSTSK